VTDRDKETESIIEKDALIKVQTLAQRLRKQNSKEDYNIDYTIPIGYEERVGHLDHEPVKRVIIYLRSSGCEWVKKTGGCTMCGFYDATSHGKKISENEYISQFNSILNTINLNNYPIVCIYNDGSIFNENELPITTLEKICKLIIKYQKVKKIVLESRIGYATEDRVRRIKKSIDGKNLEIAFGFETSNQKIMKLCINKGFH
jgi:radical SAM enzyme (TIGR01210 family)